MNVRGLFWMAALSMCAVFWLAVALAAGAPQPW
jgi:hypothetical protein